LLNRADQLHGNYHFDHWVRTRKWLWSIWMWAIQVLLMNTYVLYKITNINTWKTPANKMLSQYAFQKRIALAWISSERDGEVPKTLKHKVDDDNSDSVRSTQSYSSSSTSIKSNQKGIYVIDDSLNPTHGSLKIRLSGLNHHLPHQV
jgi:hypothetical protein